MSQPSSAPPSTTTTPQQQSAEITQQQQSMRELEYPFLKVPFERLNNTFRASQKLVEKDLSVIEKAVKEMNKKATKSKVSQDDACKYLDKVVSRLVGVKRKLEETDVEQERQLNICRARMEHLDPSNNSNSNSNSNSSSNTNSHGSNSGSSGSSGDVEWNKIRLNRILVDYMLRNQYYDSANELANVTQIADLVDINVFLESRSAMDGLRNKDCTAALNWCNEHRSKLKKLNCSLLEFELRVQEFIELVRRNEKQEAIRYARRHFKREPKSSSSSTSSSITMEERQQEEQEWFKKSKLIQRAMALLAFGAHTNLSPYRELFSNDRWTFLCQLFQESYFKLFSLTRHPLLYLNLQAGLSALKNPLVYQEEQCNVNDPMCHKLFQDVAQDLPYSFHVHSKLVCRISGKLMDDRNPPMVLPNGNVYSLEAMEQMALNNQGKVQDPRTGEHFAFSSLKKSFIV